ncbi:hypothetical protein [Metallibacterium scheffleri]|nr:hypothetical protein [Metallibacterium scheffleri]
MDDKATGALPVMVGTKPSGVLNATYAFSVEQVAKFPRSHAVNVAG